MARDRLDKSPLIYTIQDGNLVFVSEFKDLLPDKIFHRKKMGFALPIGFWFKNELKDFIKAVLLSEKANGRGYFDLKAIKIMLEQHFESKKDFTHQIWSLLMLEMWHEEFID